MGLALLLLGAVAAKRGNPFVASTVAAFVGIVMCAYPLPNMAEALEKKKMGLMGSSGMNVAMFCCCAAWVVHASVVEFDVFVLASNAVGVLVQGGALLLRFYLWWGGGEGEDEAPLL